jgi:hypothetical protein
MQPEEDDRQSQRHEQEDHAVEEQRPEKSERAACRKDLGMVASGQNRAHNIQKKTIDFVMVSKMVIGGPKRILIEINMSLNDSRARNSRVYVFIDRTRRAKPREQGLIRSCELFENLRRF